MSLLADDLLAITDQVARHISLPPIRSFMLAPVVPSSQKNNNFAILLLEDDTVGITYVALDNAAPELQSRLPGLALKGRDVSTVAHLYAESASWQRALGLAAINAISQVVLNQSGILNAMPDNLSVLNFQGGDKVGMVGYFGRLVEPLRALGIPLTVIELDESLLMDKPGIEVTLDTQRLTSCNKVIITGTTLLNHTLEHILEYCTGAGTVMMLGPSASCLPDALFRRGVTLVGGFHVISTALFTRRWSAGERWRDAGLRYGIASAEYPELADLLEHYEQK